MDVCTTLAGPTVLVDVGWRQNLIVFNPGFTPHPFFSDTEVLAAAAGRHPEITIVVTNEMYRCSVVGRK